MTMKERTMKERYRRADEYVRAIDNPDERKRCKAMLNAWDYGYGSWPQESRMTPAMRELSEILYPKEIAT